MKCKLLKLWFTMLYTWNYYDIANQLYFNKMLIKIKNEPVCQKTKHLKKQFSFSIKTDIQYNGKDRKPRNKPLKHMTKWFSRRILHHSMLWRKTVFSTSGVGQTEYTYGKDRNCTLILYHIKN